MDMLTEIQYLPPVEYFVRLLKCKSLIIEAHENYQKQSFRNRCRILGSNKVEELSIPVKKSNSKVPVRDIKIDYDQKWLPVHWKSICSAYGKSPFFEYYSELFHQIFFKKHIFLFDLDMELLDLVLRLLNQEVNIEVSDRFLPFGEKTQPVILDFRNEIHPKRNISNLNAVSFVKYTQMFGKDFVPNLSIIDLLFCEGPNSSQILMKCQTI